MIDKAKQSIRKGPFTFVRSDAVLMARRVTKAQAYGMMEKS
jgi:hypothetical protein